MILAPTGATNAARLKRRSAPIHFYTGRNGAGKSLCAVFDSMPTLDAGRPVLSTVRLLDYNDPRQCTDLSLDPCDRPDWHGETYRPHMASHPCYVPFTHWEQLLGWSFGDVLMDEITGVADSNENAALPAAVGNMLAQLRRDDIAVRITGLSWIRANKRLREAVQAVTRCTASMPVPSRKLPEGYNRIWVPRRLARWVTYDAQSLPVDDHTENSYKQAHRLVRSKHWIPTSPAISAYDTNDPVLSVGTVTDAGRCVTCGGTRRAPECSCSDYVHDRAERKAGRAQGAPAPSTARARRIGRHSADRELVPA